MLWFDQGIKYILTHLELLFDEKEGIIAKLMALIHFLSDKTKKFVFDHIIFTFIHERMLEACLNLYEDSRALILTEHMTSHMLWSRD